MTNDFPKTVYKYINWADIKSQRILTHNEIYFSNAKKWKKYGEFDFKFTPIERKELVEIINQIAEKMRNNHPFVYERWFNQHLLLYNIDFSKYNELSTVERDLFETQKLEELSIKRAEELMTNPEKYERLMRKFYFKHTGIFSSSISKEATILWDWKKRNKDVLNNNAICIGLDFTLLKQQLDTVGNYAIGLINFEGNKNEIKLIDEGNNFFINRLISISYTLPTDTVKDIQNQKEIRFLKFLTKSTSDKSPDRFLVLDNKSITEVLFHETAGEQVKTELQNICKSNNWKLSSFAEAT